MVQWNITIPDIWVSEIIICIRILAFALRSSNTQRKHIELICALKQQFCCSGREVQLLHLLPPLAAGQATEEDVAIHLVTFSGLQIATSTRTHCHIVACALTCRCCCCCVEVKLHVDGFVSVAIFVAAAEKPHHHHYTKALKHHEIFWDSLIEEFGWLYTCVSA